MTVTIVLGKATDAYLRTVRSTNAAAQTGPADTVNGGNIGYVGQTKIGSSYAHHQTFIGFDYAQPPATELVTTAEVHCTTASVANTALARTLELWGYGWSGGGLTVNDWRSPSAIGGLNLYGQMRNIHQTAGQRWIASQEDLTNIVPTVTSFEFVLTEYRQRNNYPPTSDETIGIYTADADGTANDPALVFTSVAYSKLVPALGANVQLSNGDWVYLITSADSARTAALWRVPRAGGPGSASQIGTVPRGTTSDTFAAPPGAQGLALAVDSSDHLYVIGRRGNSQNMIAGCCFFRQQNGTYVQKAVLAASLPSYDSMINNVAVTWHSHAGGRLMALVGHSAGTGGPSTHEYSTSDLVWAVLDASSLRNGSGQFLRSSDSMIGYMLPETVVTPAVGAPYTAVPTNDTGTLLDVVAAGPQQPTWGFAASVTKQHTLGGTAPVTLCMYEFDGFGSSINDTTYITTASYALKDASAKLRVLRISSTVAAVVTADPEPGVGISISVEQFNGSTVTNLGNIRLGPLLITNIPGEGTLAASNAWDAVYNSVDNRIWIYYVDVLNQHILRRTAVDMSSMKAVGNSVQVIALAAGQNIRSIRAPRNVSATDRALLNLSHDGPGGAPTSYATIDLFNLAPTQPTLTPVNNYDATTGQLYVWTFNDPNASSGDTQSAYQLVIEDVDTGVTALDTGKVLSAVSSRTVAGGTLTNVKNYRWRVKTWDAQDEASPWSEWGTFSTAAGGSVSITNPATDNPLGLETDDQPITWVAAGIVQSAYRLMLRRLDTNVVVQDTNWVTSTATTATVSGMLSDVQYRVELQLRNASAVVSSTGTRLLLPSFSVPEQPSISLAENADEGYILVSVTNPLPGQPDVDATEFTFEDGTVTGWTGNACTVAADNSRAHTGTYSMLMTTTGTPTQSFARNYADPGIVTPGQRYTVTVWAWALVSRVVTAAIDWNQTNGTYVSTTAVNVTIPANTWTKITATGTCPALATRATYGPSVPNNPSTGTQVWVDDITLTAATDRPDVARNQILRRRAGSTGAWTIVGDAPVDGSIRDYGVTSGVEYEYIARGHS